MRRSRVALLSVGVLAAGLLAATPAAARPPNHDRIEIPGLRGIASAGWHVMGASWLGKAKTLSQNVAIGALIFHYETLGLPAHAIGMTLLAASTALTLWSGFLYFQDYFRVRASSDGASGGRA